MTRSVRSNALVASLLLLAACGEDAVREQPLPAPTDPLLAQALNDPLMVDPDLAYRNEANAALGVRYSHPLPPIDASEEAAQAARAEARLDLLKDGEVLDLPEVANSVGSLLIADPNAKAAQLATAIDAPAACVEAVQSDFIWAAQMPEAASIMPHGQTRQAAGADLQGCRLRAVRYWAPARINDVLHYHYNQAHRAGLETSIYRTSDGAVLQASGRNERLLIQIREGPSAGAYAMRTVELVYFSR